MRKFSTNPTGPRLRLVTAENKALSEYRCVGCEGTSDDFFALCPGCGALDTCVRIEDNEGETPTVETSNRALNARFIETRKVSFLSTGRPAWDHVLGGGAVVGSSILVAGRGGVGKSTSALLVASSVAKAAGGSALYASSERPKEWVKQLALRVGLGPRHLARLFISDSKDLEQVTGDVEELRPSVVVWDSIQRFRVAGRLGDRELVQVVSTALEYGAAINAVTFLLSQVTKDGTPVGPNGIDHDADVVLFLRRTRTGRVVVECPEKNRFAPTPARAIEGSAKPKRRR